MLANPVQKDFTLMNGIEGELIGMMSCQKETNKLDILEAHNYIVNQCHDQFMTVEEFIEGKGKQILIRFSVPENMALHRPLTVRGKAVDAGKFHDKGLILDEAM